MVRKYWAWKSTVKLNEGIEPVSVTVPVLPPVTMYWVPALHACGDGVV